jgi:hypothetical protein
MTACFIGILVVVLHLTLTPNTPLLTQCPARNPGACELNFTETQDWINDQNKGFDRWTIGWDLLIKRKKAIKIMLLIYRRGIQRQVMDVSEEK